MHWVRQRIFSDPVLGGKVHTLSWPAQKICAVDLGQMDMAGGGKLEGRFSGEGMRPCALSRAPGGSIGQYFPIASHRAIITSKLSVETTFPRLDECRTSA